LVSCFQQCQYIRGQGKADPYLRGLEIASRHFARLVVALHVIGDLLAFNDFAHSGTLDGRDVHEGIGAAVVRLNKAKAFGGIKPFNCASGHDEPFHSNIDDRDAKALRMMITIVLKGGFVQGTVLIVRQPKLGKKISIDLN